MSFYLDLDMKPVEDYARALGEVAEKQFPFAAAQSLNELAIDGRADVLRAIKRNFDKPTKFTQNGVAVLYAKKDQLRSTVLIKDQQAKYLGLTETGGTRKRGDYATSLFGIVVPANVPVNRYGNLSRNKLKSLRKKKNVFVGSIRFRATGKTVTGVWQRPKRSRKMGRRDGTSGSVGNTQRRVDGARTGLKLLARFDEKQSVAPRLKFGPTLERRADIGFERAMDRAFRKAMATARA